MSKKIKGIRKILISLHWYWQRSFNICLCIKRKIHINHQLRLKELRTKCRQHWRIKRKLHQTFQKVFLRGRIELRRRSLKFRSEEGKHRYEGIKNDEGHSGTICTINSGKDNANYGTCN